MRLLDFIRAVLPAPPPPSPPPILRQSLRQLPRAVGTAGPQLPASALPTLCKGHWRQPSLTTRRAYGNFQSPIRILWILVWCSNNTAKKVVFALACFPYMQWHNGIINHRYSIACSSMYQMKHTTLFEPQLSWPEMELRTTYGNMFMTNTYVKFFALLTKPKENLMI